MARSTWLVILIKSIYTLWSRKRFLLPVTYFPTNLVYPFTLRVTGIKIDKNWFKKRFAISLLYLYNLGKDIVISILTHSSAYVAIYIARICSISCLETKSL